MSPAPALLQRTSALDRLADALPQLLGAHADLAPSLDPTLRRRVGGAVDRMVGAVAAVRQDHRRCLGPALYAMGGLSVVSDEVLWALELAGSARRGSALEEAVADLRAPLTDLALLATGASPASLGRSGLGATAAAAVAC